MMNVFKIFAISPYTEDTRNIKLYIVVGVIALIVIGVSLVLKFTEKKK